MSNKILALSIVLDCLIQEVYDQEKELDIALNDVKEIILEKYSNGFLNKFSVFFNTFKNYKFDSKQKIDIDNIVELALILKEDVDSVIKVYEKSVEIIKMFDTWISSINFNNETSTIFFKEIVNFSICIEEDSICYMYINQYSLEDKEFSLIVDIFNYLGYQSYNVTKRNFYILTKEQVISRSCKPLFLQLTP